MKTDSEIKTRLEAYIRDHGIEWSSLIEQALQHYLAALEKIPADMAIPSIVVPSRAVGEELARRLENPPPPTESMKALFDD